MQTLIVDDDSNFRRSLAIGLEAEGFTVIEMKGGMDVLEYLDTGNSHEDVDHIIMDVRMPGLDGFWLADQISSLYPSIRVIILSAYSYPSMEDQYTLLEKPVEIRHLVRMLQNKNRVSI